MKDSIISKRKVLLIAVLALFVVAVASIQTAHAVSVPTATAQVKSSSGATLRKKASTSSAKIKVLANNTKMTVKKQVFISKTSTSKKKIWYQVSVGGKTGYIRADLVKNIKYTPVSGKTTTALNYRVGASDKMKKKGTFKKGATLSVVLKANLKGKSTVWYKVKSGSKYYFVSSKYVKLVEPEAVAPAVSSSSSLTITTSGIVAPTSFGQGSSCSIKGTISSNKTIQKVVVGAVNSLGLWALQQTVTVNAKTFDIAKIDKDVKFGLLAAGNYTYRVDVYVDGAVYNKVSKSFTVTTVSGPTLLANTAKTLAWPVGTAKATYAYAGGAPTPAYKIALDKAYPSRSSWNAAPRAGASCDVFIGTVCVYSGYDKNMKRSLSGQWTCFEDTSKWTKVNYSYKESELRNGDIIIYKKTDGSGHVCMYVTINGEGYLAEAALSDRYGMINSSISKILKSSDKSKLAVYRAVK